MNAGAEYVLYRIWAALQDRDGIHAESLLTCVGALAGYACQVCVRQAAALPGADPRKFTLRSVVNRDGTTSLSGDALNGPLTESPLSVWALVRRAVQKLGAPPPDLDGIFRHVSQTIGTRAFGVPRVPYGHRPRQSAIVYLKQVWPQILPIAQRFCRKPAQIPVLFGIALQRAIEQTKGMLSPTLGASIAMECAVAMSQVALPGADANPAISWPEATEITVTPAPIATPTGGTAAEPIRAIREPKRKSAVVEEPSMPRVGALVASLSPAARMVTLGFLAFIAVAGVMYKSERSEAPEAAREVRRLETQQAPQSLRVFPSTQEAQSTPELPSTPFAQAPQVAQATPAPQPAQTQPPARVSASTLSPEDVAEGLTNADSQAQASSDGSSEMVLSADL
jgi:hypothetical protein